MQLQEHRFLFLRRPEHLSSEQQEQLAGLLASPAGAPLQLVREFVEEWNGHLVETRRRAMLVGGSTGRFETWQSKQEYGRAWRAASGAKVG